MSSMTKYVKYSMVNSKTDILEGENYAVAFLAYYSSNGAYYMNGFHFDFELKRMIFNTFGGGKLYNKGGKRRSKMIVLVMCLIWFTIQ